MKTLTKVAGSVVLGSALGAAGFWLHQNYECTLFDTPAVPVEEPAPVIELKPEVKPRSPLEKLTAVVADWDGTVDGAEVYITFNNKTFQRTEPRDDRVWILKNGKVYAQEKGKAPVYMAEKGNVTIAQPSKK